MQKYEKKASYGQNIRTAKQKKLHSKASVGNNCYLCSRNLFNVNVVNSLIYTTTDGNMRVEHYKDFIHLGHFTGGQSCDAMVRENMLVYVFSGQVIITAGGHTSKLRAGDTYLLRRNHKATKRVSIGRKGEPMEALFVYLPQRMMRRFAQAASLDLGGMRRWTGRMPFVMLPQNALFAQFFQSLRGYFEVDAFPSEKLVDVKMLELVLTLLEVRPDLKPLLFDFAEPWKIDISHFMEQNFTSDLSLDDFAHFTGRSLASFKKEFTSIYGEPPMRWIIGRRLDEAKHRIEQGAKSKDVYLAVGFKNLSHFSKVFKQKYGVAPSAVGLK